MKRSILFGLLLVPMSGCATSQCSYLKITRAPRENRVPAGLREADTAGAGKRPGAGLQDGLPFAPEGSPQTPDTR